jgi:hypothetical protein
MNPFTFKRTFAPDCARRRGAGRSSAVYSAFEQLLGAKADAFITARREQIISFAHRHKLPAVY